jgi:lipid-A-disaccharide synthase-like uncharacterized protein
MHLNKLHWSTKINLRKISNTAYSFSKHKLHIGRFVLIFLALKTKKVEEIPVRVWIYKYKIDPHDRNVHDS